VIIKGRNGVELAIFVTDAGTSPEVTIVVHRPGEVDPVVVNLSANHCQAFEVAVIGARLEAEARAVGQ
jgi:hypothetical protein